MLVLQHFTVMCEQVMVTNVTSLLKTVKTVEDEAARGTQALESSIEAIGQEMRVMSGNSNLSLLVCTSYYSLFFYYSKLETCVEIFPWYFRGYRRETPQLREWSVRVTRMEGRNLRGKPR